MGTMIKGILIFSLMEAAFLYKPFKEQARYVLGLVTILTTWNMFLQKFIMVGDHFHNLEHVSHTLHSHSQSRFHHLFHNIVEEGDYDEHPSRKDGNPPSECHLEVEMFRGTVTIIANLA